MKASFSNVTIRSMGYVLPPRIVTSNEIEERLAGSRLPLPKGSIESVTGVKRRRFWEGECIPSQTCTLVGNAALNKAQIDRSKIEMLVRGSIERLLDEPADACSIHHALGLNTSCEPHDVLNACLGFITGMQHIAFAIETGAIRYGLVVAGENGAPVVEKTIEKLKTQSITFGEIQEIVASFTVGCGAVAMLLCHREEFPQGPQLKSLITYSVTQHHDLCAGRGYEGYAKAKQLMEATNLNVPVLWKEIQANFPNWDMNNVDVIIPHQVSKMNIDQALKPLGVDSHKIIRTYPFLGNVASVSLPISLALALRKGYIKENGRVALLGAGSGLNLMAMGIEFGSELDIVSPSDPNSLEEIPPLTEDY